MNTSPAVVLRQYLLGLSGAEIEDPADTDPSWPCYVSSMPDEDNAELDNLACLYDTPGVVPFSTIDDGASQDRFGIQLRIRSDDYQTGWNKISTIANQVDAIQRATVVVDSNNSYELQSVRRTSPPVYIGTEPGNKRRNNFTVNFMAWIKEA